MCVEEGGGGGGVCKLFQLGGKVHNSWEVHVICTLSMLAPFTLI